MNAQIRLIDTEVRKLWDARKVSNGKLTKVEKSVVAQEKTITKLTSTTTSHSSTLETMLAELSALTKVAGDLERLAASAQRAQTDVERLADGLNKSNLERAALRKQVESNGEWIESINAFRRQVNANMVELEAEVAALSAPTMQ
jgi:chromosome segregation ATPase